MTRGQRCPRRLECSASEWETKVTLCLMPQRLTQYPPPRLPRCPLHLHPWAPNSSSLSSTSIPTEVTTLGETSVEQRRQRDTTLPPPDWVTSRAPDAEPSAHRAGLGVQDHTPATPNSVLGSTGELVSGTVHHLINEQHLLAPDEPFSQLAPHSCGLGASSVCGEPSRISLLY